MDIKKEIKPVAVNKEYTTANYSKGDIEKLITEDLKSKGHNVEKISFNTDWKYVSDEWGMNSHPTTSFEGATVELTGKE
jgi:hypothetical protein